MSFNLRVHGLDELQRALTQVENIDRILDVRDALRRGAEVGASEARALANSFSFTAADTIRAGASTGTSGHRRVGASVRAYRGLPWGPWGDFGSRRPRTGQPRSQGPWKNSGPGPRGGRFIYPAINAKRDEMVETIEDGVMRAMHRYEF